MTKTFPAKLVALQAQGHKPVDLQRVQNEALRSELESSRLQISYLEEKVDRLTALMDRRTVQLSPTKQPLMGICSGLMRRVSDFLLNPINKAF